MMPIRLRCLNNSVFLVMLYVILLRLSYPPFHCGWLAWIAYIPLLLALPKLRLCWLFPAIVLFQMTFIYWLAPINATAYALLVLILTGFDMLAAAITKRWIFLFPIIFVGTEILRVYCPYSMPFQVLGYTQYLYPLVLGSARIGGVWLVSLCIYTCNYCLYLCILRRNYRYLFIILGVFLFSMSTSLMRVRTMDSLSIGLIQPNRPMSVADWHKNRELFLCEYRMLTHEAVRQGARMVVWPETAIGVSLRNDRSLAKAVREIIDQEKVGLLIGNVDEHLFSLRFKERYNSAFYIDQSGIVRGEHYKEKLIPFIELINYQLLLPWNIRNHLAMGEYTRGRKTATMTVQGQPIATVICFEAQFPEYVHSLARHSSMIVNLSSDGWSHSLTEHECNFMVNVLRAVENHQYVVRVADDGTSAVISPQGKIIAQLPMGQRGVLVVKVPFVKN